MPNSESGFGFGQSWPNLGRRAANILALASFGLVILAGLLAAAMVERVNSAADWVAHSLEVEGRASELLGKLQDLGSAVGSSQHCSHCSLLELHQPAWVP